MIFIALVLLDQASKAIIRSFGVYSINANSAWSIDLKILNIALPIVSLAAIIYFVARNKIDREVLPLTLIISGGVSNLLDRVFFGGVVDFIDFKFFPSFNLADAMIFAGVVWFALVLLRTKRS